MIKLIVTDKNNFSIVLIDSYDRESLLSACREEDEHKTTQQEKNQILDTLKFYLTNKPFIINGHMATKYDALYAAFLYVSASPLVRKWVEGNSQPFGITLEFDLINHTTDIKCSSIDVWLSMNQLIQV